jgi:hypothetical protein
MLLLKSMFNIWYQMDLWKQNFVSVFMDNNLLSIVAESYKKTVVLMLIAKTRLLVDGDSYKEIASELY